MAIQRIFRHVLPVLLVLALAPAAYAGPFTLLGGVSALAGVPVSSDLTDTYTAGPGIAADFSIVYSQYFRLTVGFSPVYYKGTPPNGSLADNASARMWYIPAYGVFQFTLPKPPSLRPYVGVGLGAIHVNETQSFDSGIGPRDRSESSTVFSYQAMLGIELRKKGRLFAELWYFGGSMGGVEGVDGSSINLASVQLRLGFRGEF